MKCLFILAYLAVARPAAVKTGPLQVFFKEDFFLTHLKSSFVNTSISPCANFYRRICPRNFPMKSWIWIKFLKKHFDAASIASSEFDEPYKDLRESVARKIMMDTVNYKNLDNIRDALKQMSIDDICMISEYIFHTKYSHLLKKRFQFQRKNIIDALAIKLYFFFNLVVARDQSKFNIMNKKLKRFIYILSTETKLLKLVERLDHVTAQNRIESVISNIIEEYQTAIKNSHWSSTEDRFGYARGSILSRYIRELSYAVTFANNYSIPDDHKNTLYNLFWSEYAKVKIELPQMPTLQVFVAQVIAVDKALKGFPQYYHLKLFETDAFEPEAFASPPSENSPPLVLMNHMFSIHASFSLQTSSLLGFTGYAFAHEMYHQIQFADETLIEDLSDYLHDDECVLHYQSKVCGRFVEEACSTGKHTLKEDTADIYGIQIVFRVLQKMLGADIDKIAFDALNLTHRELFYYTISAAVCVDDEYAQWNYRTKDVHNGWHYRVNGMLGQLPDFKRTFGCFDDHRMVFPESSMCPVFSGVLPKKM